MRMMVVTMMEMRQHLKKTLRERQVPVNKFECDAQRIFECDPSEFCVRYQWRPTEELRLAFRDRR